MPLVQFTPLVSVVSPSFWTALSQLKLHEYQLSDELIPVRATYAPARAVRESTTGQALGSGSRVRLESSGLDVRADEQGAQMYATYLRSTASAQMCGFVKNFNTLQEFQRADKAAYFQRVADHLWDEIANGTTDHPNQFLLLTYADLKAYKYYYWFAFPALLTTAPGWHVRADDEPWQPAVNALGAETYAAIADALAHAPPCVAGWVDPGAPSQLYPLRHGAQLQDALLVFIDPSQHTHAPGWPLRNILTLVHVYLQRTEVRVLCWKDPLGAATAAPLSVVATLVLPDPAPHETAPSVVWQGRDTRLVPRATDSSKPDAVGWERNAQGRLLPKMVSLGDMFDPYQLAERAVDLNLQLMRWRVAPDLALDMIQSVEPLLIGAGTLGCHVARTLLGWGVRRMTLVDSQRVAYSNPVRQPLYEFSDCLDGGRPKALAAAEALRRVFPGVHARGVELAVPMPGHPVPSALYDATAAAIDTLDALVRQHDVVFVLTDSRESRWLPTVLGAVYNKLVINAALGFDTYVVMRHGVTGGERLGCYFCSDVMAPADSLSDRTLDQMCTVTRPGLAAMAGATAVELMASVLQHPQGYVRATHSSAQAPPTSDTDHAAALGSVPHQIRGALAQFRSSTPSCAAFPQCSACAPAITSVYEQDPIELVMSACEDPAALEHMVGLDALKDNIDRGGIDVDWASDSE